MVSHLFFIVYSLIYLSAMPIEGSPASIIRLPPKAEHPGVTPYRELVCTPEDQQRIAYIITTIAENGKLNLLFKSGELKRIGAEINHVHPFKFLATIFADPTLKGLMGAIATDYFKWNGFMDGLSPSLTNLSNQGKLDYYINDFAKEVHVNAEAIRGFARANDWEGMVYFLINN